MDCPITEVAGVVYPRDLEPRNVFLVDLRESRVLHSTLVAAVRSPLLTL